MTTLLFWTFLVAAPFGMAAYQQAEEPGWKLPFGAALALVLGLGYLAFGLPADLPRSATLLRQHPDELRVFAALWVIIAGAVCLLGALVGRLFRGRLPTPRIGAWSFLAAFIGLNALIFSGIGS